MQLPTQKTKIQHDLADQVILVHGVPKIGKTTWAAFFQALFIATEPGHKHQEIFLVPTRNWKETTEACAALAQACQSGKPPYSMVVIDTLDQMYQQAMDYNCKKYDVAHPGERDDRGALWSIVANDTCRVITKLAALPMGLILIAHSKQIELDLPTGKLQRWEPGLPGSVKNKILAMVDLTLFFTSGPALDAKGKPTGKETRWIYTKPGRTYEAGDRSGRLPARIPLVNDKGFTTNQPFVQAWKGEH